jgi:hypothetical protein
LLSLPLFLLVSSWLYCLWALSFPPSCCPSYQLWEHSLFMTWLVMRLFRSKGKVTLSIPKLSFTGQCLSNENSPQICSWCHFCTLHRSVVP